MNGVYAKYTSQDLQKTVNLFGFIKNPCLTIIILEMTEDPTYFNTLCDLCDEHKLIVGIKVLEYANSKNSYMSKLAITVFRHKNYVVTQKQTKYGWPSLEELSKKCIKELSKRGLIGEYDDT